MNNSLADRLARFLIANPHEWLSIEDIVAKFETTERYARHALTELRQRGLVASGVVYRLKQGTT